MRTVLAALAAALLLVLATAQTPAPPRAVALTCPSALELGQPLRCTLEVTGLPVGSSALKATVFPADKGPTYSRQVRVRVTPPQPQTGTLTLDVTPDAARWTLSGGPGGSVSRSGQGDAALTLPAGGYALGAALAGYREASRAVAVRAGQEARLEVALERLPDPPVSRNRRTLLQGYAVLNTVDVEGASVLQAETERCDDSLNGRCVAWTPNLEYLPRFDGGADVLAFRSLTDARGKPVLVRLDRPALVNYSGVGRAFRLEVTGDHRGHAYARRYVDLPPGKSVLEAGDWGFEGVTTGDKLYLLEADGTPTPAPAAPEGLALPPAGSYCGPEPVDGRPNPYAWVHAQYQTVGPDGRLYATWHPRVDPVYGCHFGHEHGSDPALGGLDHKPAFGTAMLEGHNGYKHYCSSELVPATPAAKDYIACWTHHFGTSDTGRLARRMHGFTLYVFERSSRELVAELPLVLDTGAAISNGRDVVLTLRGPQFPPRAAETNAELAQTSSARKKPMVLGEPGSQSYEPWRHSFMGANRTALIAESFTVNTFSQAEVCNSYDCDAPVKTGDFGDTRNVSWQRLGVDPSRVPASAVGGVYYANPEGSEVVAPGTPGAVRHYVKPGLPLIVWDAAPVVGYELYSPLLHMFGDWYVGDTADHAAASRLGLRDRN